MLQAINSKDELINVKATDNGAIKVSIEDEQGGETQEKVETTLNASVQTVGTEPTTIAINKKVTQIDIANYSESANITVNIADLNAVVGSNIATTLIINKDVENILLSSSEEETKVQLVIKGVE